jgi:hypothetical protein
VAKICRLQTVSRPQKNRTFKKDDAKVAFKLEFVQNVCEGPVLVVIMNLLPRNSAFEFSDYNVF